MTRHYCDHESTLRRADKYRSYYPGLRFGYVILKTNGAYITCVCESRWQMSRLARFGVVAGKGYFEVKKEHHHKNTVSPRHRDTFRSFA